MDKPKCPKPAELEDKVEDKEHEDKHGTFDYDEDCPDCLDPENDCDGSCQV